VLALILNSSFIGATSLKLYILFDRNLLLSCCQRLPGLVEKKKLTLGFPAWGERQRGKKCQFGFLKSKALKN
jgi:hypothetical protein